MQRVTFLSSISESESAPNRISSVPIEESFGRSGTAMVESSVSMPSLRIRRSPCSDEFSETGKTDVSARGSLVQEQPTGTGATEVSRTEGKDGELKQKKFQRNDQVMKDRFDEWEEAYKLESLQRRIDDMFMKEALLEAKKATDMWEVPVGAVLVQHGKIIARGYNLLFPNGGNALELPDKPPAPVYPLHPNILIRRGVLSAECADAMQEFFQLRRRKEEKKPGSPPTPPSCLPISNHPNKFFTKMHDAFHFMFCL